MEIAIFGFRKKKKKKTCSRNLFLEHALCHFQATVFESGNPQKFEIHFRHQSWAQRVGRCKKWERWKKNKLTKTEAVKINICIYGDWYCICTLETGCSPKKLPLLESRREAVHGPRIALLGELQLGWTPYCTILLPGTGWRVVYLNWAIVVRENISSSKTSFQVRLCFQIFIMYLWGLCIRMWFNWPHNHTHTQTHVCKKHQRGPIYEK